MIADTVRNLNAKLRAVTPRERAGLAALAAIGALTAAVYASDWAGTSSLAANTAAQHAADSEATLATLQNAAYRQRLSTESSNVRRWSQSSDAFAGETVLAELDSLAQQAGLNNAHVALVEQPAAQGQIGAIEASVTADFDWSSFMAFLESLEGAEANFAVRSIDVAEEADAQRIALIVTMPTIAPDDPQ